MSTENRKLFIKTYGCQMNVYDSARMSDVLAPCGYVQTETPEDADLIILNTCHIREKAAEKVYSELGRLRKLKGAREAKGQSLMIGVAGCVAQAEGEEIVRRAPIVDIVFGPQAYHRLPDMLARASKTGKSIVESEFPAEDKFDHLIGPSKAKIRSRGVVAFVTVQEGCDKFCSFCVVPYTRGAEFSRPLVQIKTEVSKLVDAGVREIILLGQNVNAYHGEAANGSSCTLAELICHLAQLDGVERLRYTTSHPCDVDDDLINAHRDCAKLMPYLHLPVQSGSDRILKAMNRKHTATEYRQTIAKIRAARPDIALSSDFIVGFPGETDADFEATMQIVKDVNYAQAFSFKYSARLGTPGAELEAQVPEKIKSERLARLQALLGRQKAAFNASCAGRNFDLLLEKPGNHPGQLVGRSPYLQPVHIEADMAQIGHIVPVCIDSAGANSLSAHIVQ